MRKILGTATILSSYLFSARTVFADNNAINITVPSAGGNITNINIATIPQFLVTLLFVVGIIIAIVFLIYGGIKWILSGGDSKQVESARSHIVAAIV